MELSEFRGQFPVTRTRAYLFSGALAPAAEPVRAAFARWSESWTYDPNHVYDFDLIGRELTGLREGFARLIGADPLEVAITDSTSRGSNLAVRLLAGRPGTNVVVDDTSYPSSVYPWFSMTDREVRYVATDGDPDAAAALSERMDGGTVALTVSHVAPFTGRRHDLRALAEATHAKGGLLVVDAAQSAGVVPIDVGRDGIDVLVTTAMKWLLGPPGLGFIYVRRDVLDETPLLDVGYMGLDVPVGEWPQTHLPPIVPDARRLELGLPSLPALGAAGAGIKLLLEIGIGVIFEQVNSLVDRCIDELLKRNFRVHTPSQRGMRAGVIAFEHPAAAELFAFLRRRAVDIGALPGNLVRVDPHGFNDEGDIERFLDGLDAFTA